MNDCADHARLAYDDLAPFYDRFTAHHDYEAWTVALEAIARGHGLRGSRLLDVGCGTGKSFLPFQRRGWDVAGCELSPRMAAIAATKAPAVPITVCDMRRLPPVGSFDLVCCLDDAVNYLMEPPDLELAFRAMRRNLAGDGLVLFDVNTLATYRGFFASDSIVDAEDVVLMWSGRTSPAAAPGVLAEATMTAFSRPGGGPWQRSDSVHLQRHHRSTVIADALRSAGLETVAVHGQGLDGRAAGEVDELRHTKAIYVARAAKPSEREGVIQ